MHTEGETVDIKAELDQYASTVDGALRTALMDVEPRSLREACAHYPDAGGKRLRPAVALAACEAVGGAVEDAIPLAVALEMVHNFSLIHDDMMDGDETRRGIPAVHVQWDDATAILAGDTLFAKAFEVVSEAGAEPLVRLRVLTDLSVMTRVICEGQAMDLDFEGRHATTDEYLDMIYRKTARIFESASGGGALLGGADEETARALRGYGRDFGMAFQVRDDLLDLLGTTEQIGKPAASDVRQGKKTVVLLHALEHATPAQRSVLDAAVGNPDADDKAVDAVLDVFRDTGAIQHAQDLVHEYTERALAALDPLPPGPARALLQGLAEWAAGREH